MIGDVEGRGLSGVHGSTEAEGPLVEIDAFSKHMGQLSHRLRYIVRLLLYRKAQILGTSPTYSVVNMDEHSPMADPIRIVLDTGEVRKREVIPRVLVVY
jgi:hypothetical protein